MLSLTRLVLVLNVPDEIQCKPASLIAARCVGWCPFVMYIVCHRVVASMVVLTNTVIDVVGFLLVCKVDALTHETVNPDLGAPFAVASHACMHALPTGEWHLNLEPPMEVLDYFPYLPLWPLWKRTTLQRGQ